MVAVKSSEADRWLRRDAADYSLVLVYGDDTGLVSERVRMLVKSLVDDPADPFQLVRLGGDDVARDPGRLADEAGTIPLFGGRRAVLVEAGSKPIAPAVEHLLAGAVTSPVVIEAGALKKDAPLLKAVQRARRAAAVECRPDEARDVERLIDEEIAAATLRIDTDAREMLAGLLGADRLGSRSEIAKLVLYAQGEGVVTVDMVEAVVADSALVATDAVIDAAFLGDVAALDMALRRSVHNAAEAGSVLGGAAWHAAWLHRIKVEGSSVDAVFWQLTRRFGSSSKRKAHIERQLRIATVDVLGRATVRLGEAVGQARRNPDLAASLAGRALWSVAQSLRGHAGRRG